MSAKFLLISSYPKSGNTWVRLIFETLRRGPDADITINDMTAAFHGRGRRIMFDEFAPANAADMTFEEVENTLPEIFRMLAGEAEGMPLIKVHDMAHRTEGGEWLFPSECVSSVIYLARHPFDVAVSFANHMGLPVDPTIEVMAGFDVVSRQYRRLPLPLAQRMGSWSGNALSWMGGTPYRVTFARYEDLHAKPVEGFVTLAAGAGIEASRNDIVRAVEINRFEKLQQQEKALGFKERPATSSTFFRSGKPRSWEGKLTEAQRRKIVDTHGEVMARLGYNEDGSISPIPDERAAPSAFNSYSTV